MTRVRRGRWRNPRTGGGEIDRDMTVTAGRELEALKPQLEMFRRDAPEPKRRARPRENVDGRARTRHRGRPAATGRSQSSSATSSPLRLAWKCELRIGPRGMRPHASSFTTRRPRARRDRPCSRSAASRRTPPSADLGSAVLQVPGRG